MVKVVISLLDSPVRSEIWVDKMPLFPRQSRASITTFCLPVADKGDAGENVAALEILKQQAGSKCTVAFTDQDVVIPAVTLACFLESISATAGLDAIDYVYCFSGRIIEQDHSANQEGEPDAIE